MNKRKNVYVVLTEYQFLQALNISTSVYASSNYENIIYIARNGKRLMGINSERNWSIDNTLVNILDRKSPNEIANSILDEKPQHFFIFQGNLPLNVFLGATLSERGAEISLGPDGYNSYGVFNKKHAFLSLLKDSYKANIYLIKNRLFNGNIYLFDYYKYGNQRFLDNIWITHPEQYIHVAKNRPTVLKLPKFNDTCIEFIKTCFEFNDSFPTHDVIYYFNQPLWPELIDKEFDFLKGVLNNFPDKIIVLKLHPLTSEKTKKMYRSLNGLKIIESSVPAEVILISLKNCIVFTGWSSVLITENNTCNYYFNYPIYKDIDLKFLNQSYPIILDHITLVNKPELMRFPNG
ncbi:polysialyltransferase family glycosyltransferase [Gelidibacter maritimus]|uniref:Uncharacterized protein n=1 Tax=Gelidibacter maritimus TaxID=2761487 RepID=A0A7W2M645_9FLAO|nr:polysialyltransferase family glycosyltransferase [Gelidibacter maritimus]MBA6153399.1 hypothetical protein [Gelidibacter maritimus]